MSHVDSNITDPGGAPMPPDGVPPEIGPETDDSVQPDDIREPDGDIPSIEPDPEEGGPAVPIVHA